MAFKLVVKDGDRKYKYNEKTGLNTSKVVDRVEKFDSFAQALEEFMYVINDDYADDKVSLVFTRDNKNKK